MPNHCEPTKPELDRGRRKALLETFEKFVKQIGQAPGPLTVNLSADEATYLKISRANAQAILDNDNYCGIALSFGLNDQGNNTYKLTTVVAPLIPDGGTTPSPAPLPPGSMPGNSVIDWTSPLVCDDLGQGPSVTFLPFSDHTMEKESLISSYKKFINESPSLKSLIDFVINNPEAFKENTK